MNKKQVIIGFLTGCIAPIVIMLLFVAFFIDPNIADGIKTLQSRDQLSNVIRIGLLANLVIFMFFVGKKELLARGIVIATLLILIISLLV